MYGVAGVCLSARVNFIPEVFDYVVTKMLCLKMNMVYEPLYSVYFQSEADLWSSDFPLVKG